MQRTKLHNVLSITGLSFRILISAKAAGKARADPGCARFVPERGQNNRLSLPKKKLSAARNGLAFLSMFGSGPLCT
jgi:hypothetical protein